MTDHGGCVCECRFCAAGNCCRWLANTTRAQFAGPVAWPLRGMDMASKPAPKRAAPKRRYTEKQDAAYDKRRGIKEGSPADKRLDRKRGLPAD